jgi:hypothetical protein
MFVNLFACEFGRLAGAENSSDGSALHGMLHPFLQRSTPRYSSVASTQLKRQSPVGTMLLRLEPPVDFPHKLMTEPSRHNW